MPRSLTKSWMRLRSLFGRRRVEEELAAEFAFHLEQQIREYTAQGMNDAGARKAALAKIGAMSRFEEECRDMRRVNLIEELLGDARYALRGFRTNPGFATLAILTLALGIGATTALFSLINTVWLRPLPVADADRVAVLYETQVRRNVMRNPPAPANYADWKAQAQTFESIGAAYGYSFNLTGRGEPLRADGMMVSGDFISLLGVQPAAGRFFHTEDLKPGAASTVVLSYELWRNRFGGDGSMVGQTIDLNGEPHTVLGVAPAGFQFPTKRVQLWVAPGLDGRDLANRGGHYLFVAGRLKPGVSWEQARADLSAIAARLEQQYPYTNRDVGVSVVPLRAYYSGDTSLALRVLSGSVGALLLIACTNLAHLFLARGAVRRREIAMRAALGAGRSRVIRQLLTESGLLALVAAALGAAVSTGAFRFLARLIPDYFPLGTALGFDARVLAFTAGIAMLTSLLFGAGPALQAARLDLNEVLKGVSTGSARGHMGRWRGALVAVEMALTIVLLVSAGLLVTSYTRLRDVDTGFNAENVLALETVLPAPKYVEPRRRAEFYRQVIERAEQIPGVLSAGYVTFPPLVMKAGNMAFFVEGRPPLPRGQYHSANLRIASADYLRTIGVPLLRGRMYDERDGPDSPLVFVINDAMARRYWPGENPIGAQVRPGLPNDPLWTIIGVVGDVKQMGLDKAGDPEMYFPVTQPATGGNFFWPKTLVVRSAGDPLPLAAELRRAVAAADPDQPVANIRTMNEILDNEVITRHTQATILGVFAIAALLLASVGLYGVLSYAVAQRTSEIGLRMALGAQRGAVIRGVLRQALVWTAAGTLAGLGGAYAVTRVFSSLLFEVSATDPLIFGGGTLLLFFVAGFASFLPARRAATVDPVVALRGE